jgi:hypothetical protein
LDVQECEETPKGMEKRNKSSTQDLVQVAGKLFGLEGETTTIDGVDGVGDRSRWRFRKYLPR